MDLSPFNPFNSFLTTYFSASIKHSIPTFSSLQSFQILNSLPPTPQLQLHASTFSFYCCYFPLCIEKDNKKKRWRNLIKLHNWIYMWWYQIKSNQIHPLIDEGWQMVLHTNTKEIPSLPPSSIILFNILHVSAFGRVVHLWQVTCRVLCLTPKTNEYWTWTKHATKLAPITDVVISTAFQA